MSIYGRNVGALILQKNYLKLHFQSSTLFPLHFFFLCSFLSSYFTYLHAVYSPIFHPSFLYLFLPSFLNFLSFFFTSFVKSTHLCTIVITFIHSFNTPFMIGDCAAPFRDALLPSSRERARSATAQSSLRRERGKTTGKLCGS